MLPLCSQGIGTALVDSTADERVRSCRGVGEGVLQFKEPREDGGEAAGKDSGDTR